MPAADEFATQHPQVVAVAPEGLRRQSPLDQMSQKRLECLDDVLADGEVAGGDLPALWPLWQIGTERQQCRLILGITDNDGSVHFVIFSRHAADTPTQ